MYFDRGEKDKPTTRNVRDATIFQLETNEKKTGGE